MAVINQRFWDDDLKLVHELYIRGCTDPRCRLTKAQMREILAKDPLPDKVLRKFSDTPPLCDCGRVVPRGRLLCRECSLKKWRQKIGRNPDGSELENCAQTLKHHLKFETGLDR